MRTRDRRESPLDLDSYQQSQNQFLRLKEHLPASSVESLALEIIRRLRTRADDVSIENPSDDQIEHLCHALLAPDDGAGAQYIHDARIGGATVETVYLKYLAGAARNLGAWWDEDLVSFADVTIGTSRMYAIMRAMRHDFTTVLPVRRSAVFASAPGETHTLGVRMAADLFRKEGWEIDLKLGMTHEALVSEIGQTSASLVGISAAGKHSVDAVSRLIVALRVSNPNTAIFIGGHVVELAGEVVALLDADGMASDVDTARTVMAEIQDRALRRGLAKAP